MATEVISPEKKSRFPNPRNEKGPPRFDREIPRTEIVEIIYKK